MVQIDNLLRFYINGKWVDPVGPLQTHDVINPATEKVAATIAVGSKADVDAAVAAAKAAFETFSQTTKEERVALLERIVAAYDKKMGQIAEAISEEMGAPMYLASSSQAPIGRVHFAVAANYLKDYNFEETKGTTVIRKEPIGVCGFITPWNWPANQIACKVAPAIAAGCTMVLKPSEMAPLDAFLITDVLHEAGVPAGVFNMVNGTGAEVGQALSSHPDIDMMSFTGSTRAGILVAQAAASTCKRVAQELGGKSPNIVLPTAPLEAAVTRGVLHMMNNSGQSCNAPSRMLVHRSQYEEAVQIAAKVASSVKVATDLKSAEAPAIGPVSNALQFKKIQALLQKGLDEGAKAVVGGPGLPDGVEHGYYIKPTIFANANNQMTIAREEIFGPVLTMIPYDTVEEAIKIGNDTPYGLSGYVQGKDVKEAAEVAKKIRAGNVHLNGAGGPFYKGDVNALFGGYKMSGNGREWGVFGMERLSLNPEAEEFKANSISTLNSGMNTPRFETNALENNTESLFLQLEVSDSGANEAVRYGQDARAMSERLRTQLSDLSKENTVLRLQIERQARLIQESDSLRTSRDTLTQHLATELDLAREERSKNAQSFMQERQMMWDSHLADQTLAVEAIKAKDDVVQTLANQNAELMEEIRALSSLKSFVSEQAEDISSLRQINERLIEENKKLDRLLVARELEVDQLHHENNDLVASIQRLKSRSELSARTYSDEAILEEHRESEYERPVGPQLNGEKELARQPPSQIEFSPAGSFHPRALEEDTCTSAAVYVFGDCDLRASPDRPPAQNHAKPDTRSDDVLTLPIHSKSSKRPESSTNTSLGSEVCLLSMSRKLLLSVISP
ncbi:hypothetical protein HDU93_007602 [Gonapodya sp. JEL0774]|nr:hypothetical protein HDU93_007602 [Gonapodya sp. JEL0774]